MNKNVTQKLIDAYGAALEGLLDYFGSVEEVKKYLNRKRLLALLHSPGPVAVARPWSCLLNLKAYGFSGNSYRVYDEEWRFLYEVYTEDGVYGRHDDDLVTLWGMPNGSLLRVMFEVEADVKEVLLICQNQLPSKEERYWIERWDKANQVALWRPDDHEILIKTQMIPQEGYLRIHYLPGKFTEPKRVENFYYIEDGEERGIREGVEYVDINLENVFSWYPRRSGWYLLRHQVAYLHLYHYCTPQGEDCQRVPFDGSLPFIKQVVRCRDTNCKAELEYYRSGTVFRRNAAVKLLELTGVGVRRFHYHGDGIFYLDLAGRNLTPAFPASNIYGVGSPQHALDTSNWTRLEGTLMYEIRGDLVDEETVVLSPNYSLSLIHI